MTNRLSALLLLGLLLLTACSPSLYASTLAQGEGQGTPTPTPTPGGPALTATSQALTAASQAITATVHAMTVAELQAQAAALEAQRALESIRSQQTQAAALVTQQAIQSTQAANATSTTIAIERIHADRAATQAAATSTAQILQVEAAFASTATRASFDAQSTLQAASNAALATAQAARAQSAEAAAQRVVMTNTFIAWLQALAPILAIIILAAIVYMLGWVWWRINKTRLIHPNAQGAYPMIYDNGLLINGSRSFSPVVNPSHPTMPSDETLQAQIALAETRNGAVRAIAASASPDQAIRRMNSPALQGWGSDCTQSQGLGEVEKPFSILNNHNALPSGLDQVIEADWREETSS